MNDEVLYLDKDGLRRRYVLHRPPTCPAGRRHPVVIMLDGRGGTPWTAIKSTGWSAHADAHSFLAVFPEATRLDATKPLHFLDNPQMWNAGLGSSDSERPPVDDVAFLLAVLDDLDARGDADLSRVYLSGFSNGASMAFRFAIEHAERVAALGTVAGHYRAGSGAPTQPVPLAHIFGKLDPLSPFEGGLIELPWGKTEWRPPARDTAFAWAQRLGWPADASRRETRNGATIERWGQPGEKREVLFVAVDELGHVWPGGHRLLPERLVGPTADHFAATAELWSFFSRHAL
ncbi:MAG: hypothetical protein H3C50_02245 [Kiritimatiellae bacterium]|nr:hypothetical protein [Kiritimatiellia bacterium]MCO5068504.1 hypothetical protein [Kiritimatiellia bacterium]